MKKSHLVVVLLLLSYSTLFSQKGNSINNAISDISDVFRYQKNMEYEDYNGSPYLNHPFSLGTINNTNENKIYSFQLRYNVYEDKMEIQKEDKSIVNLAKENYFDVLILGEKFILTTYEINGAKNVGYLELLFDKNNLILYKKHTRTLISAKKAKSSYEEDKPAKFVTSESFYFKSKNNNTILLPKKKKDFLKSFNNKSTEIASYMKKNKLKNSKKEDLIKILTYYSTLE